MNLNKFLLCRDILKIPIDEEIHKCWCSTGTFSANKLGPKGTPGEPETHKGNFLLTSIGSGSYNYNNFIKTALSSLLF